MALVKKGSANQFALSTQLPVLLIMETVALALAAVPLTEPTVQTPAVPVMVGRVLELVVAVTVKVDRYGALAGAPVKVTTGVSCAVLSEALLDHAE